MTQHLTTIDFHGSNLIAIPGDRPETTLVAMKPVVEGMGLSWQPQHRKIMSHPVLKKGITMTVIPSDGGEQDGTCLSLDLLNFWLATIHPDRIKNEATRAKVIEYQTECARVLFNHFFGRALARGEQTASKSLSAKEVGGIVKSVVTKMKSDLLAELEEKFGGKMTPQQQAFAEKAMDSVTQVAAEKQVVSASPVMIPLDMIPRRRPKAGSCRLPVAQVARLVGISVVQANLLLAELGLQEHTNDNNRWLLTDPGASYYAAQITKRTILWSSRTVTLLRWHIEQKGPVRAPFAKRQEPAPA
ncbi:phage antirepressor N-terminal domain-containing protein [Novacetimonas hansenii]|uniref:phage antirepressor N-terminal domain-containing protein n=1 Tax=Novacetimonas hansenii TaxID=436 RepID=UPI00177F5FDA|nr:phage antirepressor N-terminal domain-containing protein [Novacetimonas hansenii]QOF94201.1 phage antirepressor N-terminal domain-containing protein [Novacetimonas hansenii]